MPESSTVQQKYNASRTCNIKTLSSLTKKKEKSEFNFNNTLIELNISKNYFNV